MSILIKGIDMPEKHHMNGYYISDDGCVFDISRKNVVGKAIQCQKEQYNKLEQKKRNWYNPNFFSNCGTDMKGEKDR